LTSYKELGFIQYSRLTVTKDDMKENLTEKFLIGYYKGGSQKEFGISFYEINDKLAVRLEAFSISWDILNDCRELLQELSGISGADIKPDDIHLLLTRLGVKDITEELNNPQV
jgi:hypothetical protein